MKRTNKIKAYLARVLAAAMVITMAAAKTRARYALILFVLFIKPPAIVKLHQRLPDNRPVSSRCCTWSQAAFPDSA